MLDPNKNSSKGWQCVYAGGFYPYRPGLGWQHLNDFVASSTLMTHRDERALIGAKAIAYIVAWMIRENIVSRPTPNQFIEILQKAGPYNKEWGEIICKIQDGIEKKRDVHVFAIGMGLEKGITGYIFHTVPVAVYAWFHHFGDFKKTMEAVLDCGGDTDTVGAITGAITGAVVGEAGIPQEWITGVKEWPRTKNIIVKISDQLVLSIQNNSNNKPIRYFVPSIVLRNVFFLMIVLLHGFRRLLPPY